MIIPKIIKICPGCNEPLRGCACQFVEAPDGVKVHSACLDKYKQKILAEYMTQPGTQNLLPKEFHVDR